MQATNLLQTQYNSIHQILHMFADDLTETEWMTSVFPGTNRLGFTFWHLVRTWDWAIQTSIRGVPEVIADERWAGWSERARMGFGAGLSLEEADEIAQLVSPTEALAYADAVYATITSWLKEQSDEDLDRIPEMEAHMAIYPAYQLPGSREETDDFLGQPAWRLLVSACSGHMREHLGELQTLKQILRGSMGQV